MKIISGGKGFVAVAHYGGIKMSLMAKSMKYGLIDITARLKIT